MNTKNGIETFTDDEVISAIESFLLYGEKSFVPEGLPLGSGHRGYFSGIGFPARALKYHVEQLKNKSNTEIVNENHV